MTAAVCKSATVQVHDTSHRPVQPLDVYRYGGSWYDEAAQQLHDEVDRPQQDGCHLRMTHSIVYSWPPSSQGTLQGRRLPMAACLLVGSDRDRQRPKVRHVLKAGELQDTNTLVSMTGHF
jgi:hypothetical protein